ISQLLPELRLDHRALRRAECRYLHPPGVDVDQRAISRDRGLPARRGGCRLMAQRGALVRPGGRGFGGGGMFGMGPPPAKTKDVGKTLRQLLGRLGPERVLIVVSAVLALGSVAFSVIGPKIIGNATNVIFDGVLGKSLPAGLTKAQAVALLRAHGQNQIADVISGANV